MAGLVAIAPRRARRLFGRTPGLAALFAAMIAIAATPSTAAASNKWRALDEKADAEAMVVGVNGRFAAYATEKDKCLNYRNPMVAYFDNNTNGVKDRMSSFEEDQFVLSIAAGNAKLTNAQIFRDAAQGYYAEGVLKIEEGNAAFAAGQYGAALGLYTDANLSLGLAWDRAQIAIGELIAAYAKYEQADSWLPE